MIYISIDHATINCHSSYSMNRKYEYATDKIYNLIGNEGTSTCVRDRLHLGIFPMFFY